jgi:hypothetical protein
MKRGENSLYIFTKKVLNVACKHQNCEIIKTIISSGINADIENLKIVCSRNNMDDIIEYFVDELQIKPSRQCVYEYVKKFYHKAEKLLFALENII